MAHRKWEKGLPQVRTVWEAGGENVVRDVEPTPSRAVVIRPEEEAYHTMNEIIKYSGAIKVYYIHVGQLLKKARDEKHWEVLGFDGWWEYLRDLGISVDGARKMIGVIEHVLTQPFVDGTETPTWTAMVRLLPMAREGKLTKEVWEDAKVLHDADLRRTLGHNLPTQDSDVTCPLCGGTFKRKEKDERVTDAITKGTG